MAPSRPYHRWTRTVAAGHSTDSLAPAGIFQGAWPIAHVLGAHRDDDLVERVFLHATISGMERIGTGDFDPSNDWPAAFVPMVCAGVYGADTGGLPNPIDEGGPQTQLTLTGGLDLRLSQVATVTEDVPFVNWTAGWSGSFESQGTRVSPAAGELPQVIASMRVLDLRGASPGEPLAAASNWTWTAYIRVLFASRVAF